MQRTSQWFEFMSHLASMIFQGKMWYFFIDTTNDYLNEHNSCSPTNNQNHKHVWLILSSAINMEYGIKHGSLHRISIVPACISIRHSLTFSGKWNWRWGRGILQTIYEWRHFLTGYTSILQWRSYWGITASRHFCTCILLPVNISRLSFIKDNQIHFWYADDQPKLWLLGLLPVVDKTYNPPDMNEEQINNLLIFSW